MNDIALHNNQDGTFDWTFNSKDLEVVRGVDALINSVIHTLLLQPEELLQYLYADKGNPAYNYLNDNNSSKNLEFIQQYMSMEVEKIDGITLCDLKVYNEDNIVTSVDISFITDDGEEVIVDGLFN